MCLYQREKMLRESNVGMANVAAKKKNDDPLPFGKATTNSHLRVLVGDKA